MPDGSQSILDRARHMLADGEDLEAVISFLRENGSSKVLSIRMVMELSGLTLAEAKRRVHESSAWHDVKKQDEEFHAALESALSGGDAAKTLPREA